MTETAPTDPKAGLLSRVGDPTELLELIGIGADICSRGFSASVTGVFRPRKLRKFKWLFASISFDGTGDIEGGKPGDKGAESKEDTDTLLSLFMRYASYLSKASSTCKMESRVEIASGSGVAGKLFSGDNDSTECFRPGVWGGVRRFFADRRRGGRGGGPPCSFFRIRPAASKTLRRSSSRASCSCRFFRFRQVLRARLVIRIRFKGMVFFFAAVLVRIIALSALFIDRRRHGCASQRRAFLPDNCLRRL